MKEVTKPLRTYNCPFDGQKAKIAQEALRNYFTLQKLEFVEDEIQGETGWSWIAVVAERKKKNGDLKNFVTTVAISKLSETQLQVSYGKEIKAFDIFKTIGAGTGWLLVSPLAPLISIGIIGGVIATVALTSKRSHVEKEINNILKIHFEINEKGKKNEQV